MTSACQITINRNRIVSMRTPGPVAERIESSPVREEGGEVINTSLGGPETDVGDK